MHEPLLFPFSRGAYQILVFLLVSLPNCNLF
jgi:hypothetical protein